MADAPVETTRPTPPEALKPKEKDTRETVVSSFRKSVALMESAAGLSPQEKTQLENAKEFAKKTFENAEHPRDYDSVTFELEDKRFRTHERVPVDGILQFLDKKIKSGTLTPEQQEEYQELLGTLARHSKPYERGKRNEPLQKVARTTHEAKELEAKGNVGKHEDGYIKAADALGGRLELILPKETPLTPEEEILANGISLDEALHDPTTAPDTTTPTPSDGVHAPSRHRPPETMVVEEPPAPEPKTPEDLKREMLVVNREDDFFKRAREVADTHLQEVLRGEGDVEGRFQKTRKFFKRIKYRMAEEYYRQKFTQQAYKAMVDSGNPYLQMELVKNTLQISSATHGGESSHRAGVDTAERLKTGGGYETERVSDEVGGPLRDELMARLVRPIFNGEITDRAQVQEVLKTFVQEHKDDPAVKEFFGSETTQMGKVAENFATDLLEMGQGLRADFDTHGFAVDHLDQAVSLRFATAEWGALQKRAIGKEELSRTDRMVRWCQKRRLTGAIFNPAVIGATSSLATFAILRAPGRALSVAGHIATPGVGMLTGGAFGAIRRNYDLKVDRAMHNVERAYGGRIGPDSKRRERMEQFRYQTVSARDLLQGRSGDEPLKSMQELMDQDLSQEVNRQALIQRLAEIEGREDFSVREKIDLITFDSREGVEGERLQLSRAKAEARVKLRKSGLSDVQIQSMRDELITEALRPRFEQDQAQKDKAFKVHRVRESMKAGAFGAVAGLGVGFGAHEAATEVLHRVGVGGGSYTSEMLGGHRRSINPDSLTQLRQHGGSINIDNDVSLRFDPVKHTGEIFNTKTGQQIPAELKINPNGHIHVKGELPPGLEEKLHDGGFDIDKGPLVDGTKIVHSNGEVLDSAIGHQTKIPKGTEWLQDPANPGKWNLVESGHPNNILVHDAQFDGSGRLLGYDTVGSKTQVNVAEIVTQKEFATGETAAAELDKYGTHVGHREWYAYNTPYSERNELTAYNSIFDAGGGQKGVVWDMSQMQLGYQNHLNPNPIDVQQVIASHQAGFAFSVPGHDGTPVWVSDGADGVWDGKVTLNPNDFTNHIDPNNPSSLTLGEFSQKILNQGALQRAVEQNIAEGKDPSFLASELTHRENVFNLGLNGKMGYIEAGRMLPNTDGTSTFQVFATGRGSTDVQFDVIKEVQTTFNLTQEVAVKIPTYELFAGDSEIFPIIPFPFVPRYPLEPLSFREGFSYGYGYAGGELSVERRRQFEERRSKTLQQNPRATLDPRGEMSAYLEREQSSYSREVEGLAGQISTPPSESLKAIVCIPVAGHQEGGNIYTTLKNYTYQDLPKDQFEVILFVNYPGVDQAGKAITPDNTMEEIVRFQKEHPNFPVRVMTRIMQPDEANIGTARKMLTDAALLRSMQRGDGATEDIILISNDADMKGASPKYLSTFVKRFEENPEVDGFLGQLDWDPEAYVEHPAVHIGTRLFQYLGASGRVISHRMPSSGANFAFKGSAYAGIGGYIPNSLGEDIAIGEAILLARSSNRDAERGELDGRGCVRYAGGGTRLYTSARRSIDALRKGLTPIEQWDSGFSAFEDDLRKMKLGEGAKIDYEDPIQVERVKEQVQWVISQTIDNWDRAEGIGKGHPMYRRAIGFLGAKYDIVDGEVVLTDVTKLIEGLKRYQDIGTLLRDIKSGKGTPENRAELERLLGSDKKEEQVENEDVVIYRESNIAESAGGSGKVYVAQDKHTGEFIAAKQVNLEEQSEKARLNDFPKGITDPDDYIRAHVDSDLILLPDKKISIDDQEYKLYPLGDTDLDKRLDDGPPLSAQESLNITVDVVSALQQLHEAGVYHTDIAPVNVLIMQDGTTRLIDFDNASIVNPETGKAKGGIERGNRWITAPELYTEIDNVSPAADTYEASILLHKLITGKNPYKSVAKTVEERAVELEALHQKGEFDIPDEVPEPIKKILKKGIQPNPADRYQTAEEMLKDLVEAQSEVAATPAPTLPDAPEPEPEPTPTSPVPPVRPTPPTSTPPATAEATVTVPTTNESLPSPELVKDMKEGDRTVLGGVVYELVYDINRGNRLEKVQITEIEEGDGVYAVVGKSMASNGHPTSDEDSIIASADQGFIGVFDGVGGESAGNIASGIASKTTKEILEKIPTTATRQEVWNGLNEVVIKTQQGCVDYVGAHPEAGGMGTTGTIAKIFNDAERGRSVAIMHAGDSRLYLLQKDGAIRQLTTDHSLIYQAVQKGNITKEEGERLERELDEITSVTTDQVARDADPVWQKFLARNTIVKTFNRDVPDVSLHQIQENDSLIFATSDGIHDNLTRSQIEEIAKGAGTKQELTERLIEKAQEVARARGGYENVRGKNDDMSVVVMSLT